MKEDTVLTFVSDNTVCVSASVYTMLVRKASICNRLSGYLERAAEKTDCKNYLGTDEKIICFELTGLTPEELIAEAHKPLEAERSDDDAEADDHRQPDA